MLGRLRERAATAWAPLRLLPLLVVPLYLTLLFGAAVTAVDWPIGMAAAAATVAGGRAPLTVALVQPVLLVLAVLVPSASVAVNVVLALAVLALAELWMRRQGAGPWVGAVALAVAQVVTTLPRFDPLLSTSAVLFVTVAPMLVGQYVRSVLQVAIEAERSRELAVSEARTAERTAIARELHDLVAHHLSSIAVRTGAARFAAAGAADTATSGGDATVAEVVDEVHRTARSALADLRRLLVALREPAGAGPGAALADPAGLHRAIASAVTATRAAGITVDAQVDAVEELDAARRLAVLRIVQEGLTNVREHAGPGAGARVRVRVAQGEVEVDVIDDGAGTASASTGHGRGLGLVGMSERVEMLDGTLEAGPAGAGWRVRAVLPGGTA